MPGAAPLSARGARELGRSCIQCPSRTDHLQMAATTPPGGSKLLTGLYCPHLTLPASMPKAWTADMAVSD